MKIHLILPAITGLVLGMSLAKGQVFEMKRLGTFAHGGFDQGAAEIVAFDGPTKRIFVISALANAVEVLDGSDPTNPRFLFRLNPGGQPNSVAVKNGIVAVATQNTNPQLPGRAVFYPTTVAQGSQPSVAVEVGSMPDMITITPDGRYALTANEGEPAADYSVDPEGSVSVIDISGGLSSITQDSVRTAYFREFNNAVLEPSIRVFGSKPGGVRSTVAEDFEPEYIAVSADSRLAYVTLQEANAIAVIDIPSATVSRVFGLGFKDHMLAGNALDASDQNGGTVDIRNWPVYGMYQPDTIAAFEHQGRTFLITANEGDAREYAGVNNEIVRVGSAAYRLDPTAFPNATALKNNGALGRLNVTNKTGDTDGDGDFDRIYAFGARSFSIWDVQGVQMFDSGDAFEQFLIATAPTTFNVSHTNNTRKNRSDDKGPEPEGLTIGSIGPQRFAFIGLERDSGILVYDISDPLNPTRAGYVTSRDFTQDPALNRGGDLGPEGLEFVAAADSPTGKPLVIVGNEISGTTSIYEVRAAAPAGEGLAISFAGFSLDRSRNLVTGTVTLTNNGNSTVTGPLYLTMPGVTLTGGTIGTTSYVLVTPSGIRPGSTERVAVSFELPNPNQTNLNQLLNTLRPRVLAGNL
jgi:2',3'-cyclic-nucleotide 2'-phosphodiesterase / 3'-nucleotidase / 5'-nucleotidase